ncbi:hypothetical protein RchiOBHm_Chr4g0417291 [Rosa chinensis]|uniref:Uncharacterized protein n=1 Tax=Rosa chinensis TaxID=74649 RepID=A0A2P6QX17_ROSCH|nr:hypothetical protein RchiOBHm_Chr4g0417291 [Rosa chinensis]
MFIKTIAHCLENQVDDLIRGGEILVEYPNIENGGVRALCALIWFELKLQTLFLTF